MREFLVLGRVPGTNYFLSFEQVLAFSLVFMICLLIVVHYWLAIWGRMWPVLEPIIDKLDAKATAAFRARKAFKLLSQHHLL